MRSGAEGERVVVCSKGELKEDVWYFVELYHLNGYAKSKINLIIYLDSKLLQEGSVKPYQHKLTYADNTIGCSTQEAYMGGERTVNHFRGEMSALYFIAASPKNAKNVSEFLHREAIGRKLDSLLECSKQNDAHEKIIEDIFIQVNPKYSRKYTQSKQRVYVKAKQAKPHSIYNGIERLHKGAKAKRHTRIADSLSSMGGIKAVLPLLHGVAERKHNPHFVYCVGQCRNVVAQSAAALLTSLMQLATKETAAFFEAENGLVVLRLLFERVSIGLTASSPNTRLQ